VWAPLADDHPHALRPPGQVQQAGDLQYPGPVAGFPVGVVGRLPVRLGDRGELVDDRGGQGEPDRVGQPLRDDPVQQVVRGARRVDPDQDLATRPSSSAVAGQLAQRLTDDGDVVFGGVRAGVPGPQQVRQRLPTAGGAVVAEAPQRVVPEPELVLCTTR
jgi:hypothetical protein